MDAFRFRNNNYEDILVDEVDNRNSAREGSIGRSLNFLRPIVSQNQLNLRPRLQPYNQAIINPQERINDSEENDPESENQEAHLHLNMNGRRARFLPINLVRPGGNNIDDNDDDISNMSYNYIGEEERTFMD